MADLDELLAGESAITRMHIPHAAHSPHHQLTHLCATETETLKDFEVEEPKGQAAINVVAVSR